MHCFLRTDPGRSLWSRGLLGLLDLHARVQAPGQRRSHSAADKLLPSLRSGSLLQQRLRESQRLRVQVGKGVYVIHSTLVCGFFMVDILLCFSAPRHSCLVCLFTHPSRLFVSCPRLYYLGFLGRPPRQEVEVHVRVQRRRGKVVQYHSREATGPPLSPAGV